VINRRPVIKPRTRFFLAVEGESERAFVRWLQAQSRAVTHIYLEPHLLDGGGFRSMLDKAEQLHDQQCRVNGPYRARFIIVDADRADSGDWSIEKLRREASRKSFILCAQRPNHEGLLLRMFSGMHREKATASAVAAQLCVRWPNYRKPANAFDLLRRFALADLVRLAEFDGEVRNLLQRIGLLPRNRTK